MRKKTHLLLRGICLLSLCFILAGCGNENDRAIKKSADYLKEQYGIMTDGNVPKVILDTDMAYFGDDAMCLSILVQADELGLIDLLGVTITGGNHFVAVGTNSTLTWLERMEREDIPVYMGTDEPINGFRDLQEQEKIVGSVDHWGAMYNLDRYIEPEKYHDLGADYDRSWGYSQTEPQQQSSVDFMIEQADKYPGEVTIISIGAATNIAMACEKDESFASDTAGIIYMGTIVEGAGTYTPYADFNVFYDAEAFSICLKSDFPTQTIIPHDAAESAVLNKAVFDLMDAKQDTIIAGMWLDEQYSQFRRQPTRKMNCTDAIAAVALLNPAVVQEKEELYVAINTDVTNAEYGKTLILTDEEVSAEAAYATFVLKVDTGLFWDFATDLLCRTQAETTYTYAGFVESNEAGSETAALVKKISDDSITVDIVEYIEDTDLERMQELELTKEDMPDGYYIFNPSQEATTWKCNAGTTYTFIDWGGDFTEEFPKEYTTTDIEDFQKYIETYDNGEPGMPFFFTIENGYIKQIIEKPFA